MKHSYVEKQPDVDELIASHSELVRKIAWLAIIIPAYQISAMS